MKKLSTITAIITFVTILIGIGFVAISTYGLIERLVRQHLENEKEHALIIAKQAVVLPLWNYDELYIKEILSSSLDEELDTVVAIKVHGADQVHHYSAVNKNFKDKDLSELVLKKEITLLTDTITYRGRDLGRIELYYSSEQFDTAFKKLGSVIFFITVSMGIFVATGMFYGLRRLITKPLFEIATDAGKVGQGNYNVKFKTNYVGELNVVTESFNETIKAIQERDVKLHDQNSLLEKLVDERTKERDVEQFKSFQASRLASLGEMAGAIAHEINNPLAIIQGHSRLLKENLIKSDNPDLAQKAEKIYETSERIAKIIKGLKSFSRDGANDPAQICKIESFVEDLTSICMNRSKERDVNLTFHFNPSDEIYANITELGQVLINLINNSIDAIEFLDERWIQVNFETLPNASKITVTDSGLGIDEKIIDKIMNPFFTTKELGKGTGLGLSISQGIITRYGGDFYYNRQSKNTQFVIILPKISIISRKGL